MANRDDFHDGILGCLPHLAGFAHLLCRNHALAEDLVQETVVRALTYREQFKPGTNLKGWLLIILRNRYFNEVRKNGRVHSLPVDSLPVDRSTGEPAVSGGQEEQLHLRDFKRHFQDLPETQKEALLLVGVNGFSYEEAAEIAGCAVGTMKSRVCRARMHLQSVMFGETRSEPRSIRDGRADTPPESWHDLSTFFAMAAVEAANRRSASHRLHRPL